MQPCRTDVCVRSVLRHDASQHYMQLSGEVMKVTHSQKHNFDLALQGGSHGKLIDVRATEVSGECS